MNSVHPDLGIVIKTVVLDSISARLLELLGNKVLVLLGFLLCIEALFLGLTVDMPLAYPCAPCLLWEDGNVLSHFLATAWPPSFCVKRWQLSVKTGIAAQEDFSKKQKEKAQ